MNKEEALDIVKNHTDDEECFLEACVYLRMECDYSNEDIAKIIDTLPEIS